MPSFFSRVFNSKEKCTNATKKMEKPYTCVGKKRFQAVPLTVSKGSPKKMGNPSGKGKKRKRNTMKVSIRKPKKNNRSAKRRKYKRSIIPSPSKTLYINRRSGPPKDLSEVKKTLNLYSSSSNVSMGYNNNSNNSLGVRKKRTRRRRKKRRKRRNSRKKRR